MSTPDTQKAPLPRLVGEAHRRILGFYQVLVNTLVANVTSSFLWFALTFWVYLETRSVMATAFVGGAYMLLVAAFGIVFGVIVDRMRKKNVMILSSMITLVCYGGATALYLTTPSTEIIGLDKPAFWLFSAVILVGSVVEQLRNIALSTTVTLLVPADRRDRANGLVGTVQGVAFMVTSVFSGLSVGLLGMGWTVIIAFAATGLALVHLVFIRIPERTIAHVEGAAPAGIRGVLPAVLAVPGLIALLLFTTFNNLVGGVFMALMDPYGLTLFPVEVWGVLLGVTSIGFIVGGGIIAKVGLGSNPVRTLLLVNAGIALIGMTFTLREWGWLYIVGMFVFMAIMPAAEAAEQTIIQRVVPFEKQGRVFGFAASVESAAAPITAFLIGPAAELWLIPYMEGRSGQATFGWLLGDGDARGMALVFTLASLVMLVAVAVAFLSPQYRRLSRTYAESTPPETGGAEDHAGTGTDSDADAADAVGDASDAMRAGAPRGPNTH